MSPISTVLRSAARPLLRRALSATVYPEGSIRTILAGPSRGLSYRIFADFGLSPLYGGWEPDAQRLMLEHVRAHSVAYDIGANYGIHVLLMARLTGDSGHVYAFEPAADVYAELEQNISLNKFRNVSSLPLAVADVTSHKPFLRGLHRGAGHIAEPGEPEAGCAFVETVTLDDFVFGRENRPPDFIKIDVEGAEGSVLAGAERVLNEARPVMLIDLHSPAQDVVVGQILSKSGYVAYRTGKTGTTTKVEDLSKGWPTPNGVWGQIVAFPGDRT